MALVAAAGAGAAGGGSAGVQRCPSRPRAQRGRELPPLPLLTEPGSPWVGAARLWGRHWKQLRGVAQPMPVTVVRKLALAGKADVERQIWGSVRGALRRGKVEEWSGGVSLA